MALATKKVSTNDIIVLGRQIIKEDMSYGI